eukprot:CAMPEP_0197028256 /NCGR_PEP_ID=MMETSP1384-20130603/7981_1 /TAXON_ID=29189 /ORGANISM="Ammonia sp." /LENGTH=478 /DNA_ID=CAMNT_0042457227 /DNA_START=376 /DNA_END=1814 /DNA_ORIENTATION=-
MRGHAVELIIAYYRYYTTSISAAQMRSVEFSLVLKRFTVYATIFTLLFVLQTQLYYWLFPLVFLGYIVPNVYWTVSCEATLMETYKHCAATSLDEEENDNFLRSIRLIYKLCIASSAMLSVFVCVFVVIYDMDTVQLFPAISSLSTLCFLFNFVRNRETCVAVYRNARSLFPVPPPDKNCLEASIQRSASKRGLEVACNSPSGASAHHDQPADKTMSGNVTTNSNNASSPKPSSKTPSVRFNEIVSALEPTDEGAESLSNLASILEEKQRSIRSDVELKPLRLSLHHVSAPSGPTPTDSQTTQRVRRSSMELTSSKQPPHRDPDPNATAVALSSLEMGFIDEEDNDIDIDLDASISMMPIGVQSPALSSTISPQLLLRAGSTQNTDSKPRRSTIGSPPSPRPSRGPVVLPVSHSAGQVERQSKVLLSRAAEADRRVLDLLLLMALAPHTTCIGIVIVVEMARTFDLSERAISTVIPFI